MSFVMGHTEYRADTSHTILRKTPRDTIRYFRLSKSNSQFQSVVELLKKLVNLLQANSYKL